jgi:RecB family exonuclease
VITPRTTRLLRVPDLQGMHRAIAECASGASAVIVPTAAAGDALRRTLRTLHAGAGDILTRDELYARLHGAIGGAPAMLSAFEREVLLIRAAEAATAGGFPPPFRLRPGLVIEILAFYDELRRRDRTVADFDRLMTDSLQSSIEIDRGAERLFRQTQFLAAAFNEFERLVEASGRVDEHALRTLLLEQTDPAAFQRIVITVADQVADPRGLWTADFDLLARLHGLEAIDVIATENLLAAGFHERVHDLFPGIEESRVGTPAAPPVLLAPPARLGTAGARWFVCRDREEELARVARIAAASEVPGRMAVVFQRPLPYLYLAGYVFADAGQSYQALDTLPLAAEPFAAALDVVFAFLLAEANRASTIDLLGSPHWRFPGLDVPDLTRKGHVAALDVLLRERKYLGGWDRLAALGAERAPQAASTGRRARRPGPMEALAAAVAAADALRSVRDAATASRQIRALLDFTTVHERLPDPELPWSSRHLRTRAAVLDALGALAAAHAAHDDRALPLERLAGVVRRWIEGQTFAPRTGSEGVLLLDAPAAAYAEVDAVHLVGLIENDWPERVRRSIFYPSSLLSQLGWPNELDRLTSARARFRDLLWLPTRRVSASTFTLEDDAIVSGSSFLQEIDVSGLTVERTTDADRATVFRHEALVAEEAPPLALPDQAAAWLALRVSRSPGDQPAYHGSAGARAPGVYAISHVERYLDCPFKYFAARVLQLDEERDDDSGLSPQERGQLLHEVFETFFTTWHERGGRAITADTLSDALNLFATVAESTIARLPESDRALERTYLLGSAAAPGLAERAFNFEIEQECVLVERLLEHSLAGEFEFRGANGPRRIAIRAKADRIDLLEGGALRIIDYKLSRAPKPTRALQLPIYGVCAEQHLQGRHGRDWKVASAGYVAFKEKNAFVGLGASTSLERALQEGEARLVEAVEGIERGEFPVKPEEPYRCTWCGYSAVCRKDYIGDE